MSTVFCARREDLGCTASYQDNKFASIRAHDAGWFRSYQEEKSYCPDHLPEWVPGWRAAQAAKKFEVEGAFSVTPTVLHCTGCDDLDEEEAGRDPDAVRELRARGFEHAKETGHTVTVSSSDILTIEPVA